MLEDAHLSTHPRPAAGMLVAEALEKMEIVFMFLNRKISETISRTAEADIAVTR